MRAKVTGFTMETGKKVICRCAPFYMPPWRNRLARSAVNRKVGGSSPPGGDRSIFTHVQQCLRDLQQCSMNLFRYNLDRHVTGRTAANSTGCSSVGRAEDCSVSDILRSVVQIRPTGIKLLHTVLLGKRFCRSCCIN